VFANSAAEMIAALQANFVGARLAIFAGQLMPPVFARPSQRPALKVTSLYVDATVKPIAMSALQILRA